MLLVEALEAVHAAGAVLALGADGRPVLRPADVVPRPVVEVLRAHRDQLQAVLRLRVLHRAMGLSEEDVLLVERAIIEGSITSINVISNLVPGPPVPV